MTVESCPVGRSKSMPGWMRRLKRVLVGSVFFVMMKRQMNVDSIHCGRWHKSGLYELSLSAAARCTFLTEKPKTQSFNRNYLLISFFLVTLVGFFVYTTVVNPAHLYNLSIGLLVYIIYLIPLRNRLHRKQATIALEVQDVRERANLIEDEIRHEQKARKFVVLLDVIFGGRLQGLI